MSGSRNNIEGSYAKCYRLANPRKGEDMESEHISSRKLYEMVVEKAVLDPSEIEHLTICEECMELVRVFVRQQISKGASS